MVGNALKKLPLLGSGLKTNWLLLPLFALYAAGSEEETVEDVLFYRDHVRAAWFDTCLGYLSHRNVSILDWWKKLMK